MKACVLRAPAAIETNPLDYAEVATPQPKSGEVLVRVRACGVCRTDLHVIEGELPPRKSPVIPGHQVVGVVEPGAAAAATATRNQQIVVIGTEATVSSHAYRKALEARGLSAREKACPLLVPLVEEGWVEHSVTEQIARIYLAEAFADGFHEADTLVLGCTHYPLLKPLLHRVTPGHVSIVDSAESTARAVASHLQQLVPATSNHEERRALPRLKFFATDSVEKFRRLGERFLGHPIEDVQLVDLKE